MGTRNLTAVFVDGEYKIAQYGQWDGYPEGQGKTALDFARKLADENFRHSFTEKVRACRWITEEEVNDINAKIESGEIKDWTKEYPELWRDACADILQMVVGDIGKSSVSWCSDMRTGRTHTMPPDGAGASPNRATGGRLRRI